MGGFEGGAEEGYYEVGSVGRLEGLVDLLGFGSGVEVDGWEGGGPTGRLVFGRGEGRSGLVGEGVRGVVLAFS